MPVAVDQNVQNVRNLAVLARQAISLNESTMSVSAKMVASACEAFERMVRACEALPPVSPTPADTVSTMVNDRLALEAVRFARAHPDKSETWALDEARALCDLRKS